MRGFVRNKVKDWFRRQGKSPHLPGGDRRRSQRLSRSGKAQNWQDLARCSKRSKGCLKQLPDRLNQAVKTVYFNDEPGPAAAESLGITAASLRKRLERARGQLHACITANCKPQPNSQLFTHFSDDRF